MKLAIAAAAALVACSPVNYHGHPKAVARKIERTVARQNPGATVQVTCRQVNRRRDNCQISIIYPSATFWVLQTVVISRDGHHLTVIYTS